MSPPFRLLTQAPYQFLSGYGPSGLGLGAVLLANPRVIRVKNFMKLVSVLFVLALNAWSEINTYLFGSLGEAPYQPAFDIGQSTVVPQAGIEFEYRNKYATPFVEASIGRYNHGPIFEGYVGLQLGLDIQWIRPSLLFGAGIQSVNLKEFPYFESDIYRTERNLHTPFGIGCRAEIASLFYAELDTRIDGYPWWKIELGYRIKSFGNPAGLLRGRYGEEAKRIRN